MGPGHLFGDFLAPGKLELFLGNALGPRGAILDHAVPGGAAPLRPRQIGGMSEKSRALQSEAKGEKKKGVFHDLVKR